MSQSYIQAMLRLHVPVDSSGQLRQSARAAVFFAARRQLTQELPRPGRMPDFQGQYPQQRHGVGAEDETLDIGAEKITHRRGILSIIPDTDPALCENRHEALADAILEAKPRGSSLLLDRVGIYPNYFPLNYTPKQTASLAVMFRQKAVILKD